MQNKQKWVIISAGSAMAIMIAAGVIVWDQRDIPQRKPLFLPGVYTCVAQNEFCRIADTLTIRRMNVEEDNYAVTRTSCFTRIRTGKDGPPEYQQQKWTGHYVFGKYRLVSEDGADTVWFYPKKNRVSKASFYYEKIE
ncbi:hypothetical protein Q4E93_21920 [Flavitalea sp. BT771]|uniref:hypothetical protein n=1 Tax=Flavitalea sp. BT771 TaxID=3063329 RepID=UPI0026E2F594|nr:hypothetical protein [Flavitalea sp. BT771]MDO6433284.1 hypothetical protein [Flavitalea sp. BT771]MDV6222811.1 hypothetical protein [Flavitalea sp. BT771]